MKAVMIYRLIAVCLISLAGLEGHCLAQLPAPTSQDTCLAGRCPDLGALQQPVAVQQPSISTQEPASPTAPVARPSTPEVPSPASEFQDFVSTSVGRKLPIYGSTLFDSVPSTFAPIDRVPVTADYVIGPGDEILVRAWGQIDVDARVVVDRAGEVYLPKVGTLSVAGLKYQQLQGFVATAFGKVFKNFEVNVSLGQLRSIQVFVVGQAKHPGTYTVSSLSTLVNTIFASGGPAPSGSMRHIQLKRNNALLTEFDLYDLLLHGDKSRDIALLPGDLIYIPPVGASIAIAGSVNVPAIYELRSNTTLQDAIEIAGGLTTTADGQKALVERVENRSTRKVEEFPLDDNGLHRELKDGDVVRIFSLSPKFENAVTLRGNVTNPGRYAWHEGMRIKDLIPSASVLITREYWRSVNSISTVSELRDTQREQLSRRFLQENAASSGADGILRGSKAGIGTDATTSELRNEIKRDVPEINWEYAVIQRLNPQDLSVRLLPFNLGKVVLENDPQNNLALEPGDILTIFSQADIAVAMDKQTKFVRLEGEFNASGVYKIEPGESLKHLVARVGGLTANAYIYGAELTRNSVRKDQQEALDQLVTEMEREIATNSSAASDSPGDAAQKKLELEGQRRLVEKLRSVTPTGRLVLGLASDASGADVLPDIALEDGDRLVVPYRPATVNVFGDVYSRASFIYRSQQTVGDYLKSAGGPTRNADRGKMFVVRADGSVLNKQNVGGFWKGGFESLRLMPGDSIVVPERLSRGSTMRAIKDWSQVFSQFALGVAAIRVLNQ